MSETKQPKQKRKPRAKKAAQPVLIPVLRITNPFNPKEFVREELAWHNTKTLADYFPLPATDVVVSINGKIIEREKFAATYLDKTDNLVVCPVPTGGGGGSKNILMIVAMIAVSVVTAGAGAAVAGAMMGTDAIMFAAAYGAVGVGLANAAVTIAGSLLVHAIFAPSKKTTTADKVSSSYGIDGAKNTSVEGIVVPVSYGEFRTAGNVLGLRTVSDADDNQTLYMLLSAGEGPVASLTDIQINDNPLEDYKDVEVQTRLGLPNQTPIEWFNTNDVAITQNMKLGAEWTYTTTTTVVDQLRLDFTAPGGLCEINSKDGKSKTYTVVLNVEYRPVGGEWAPLPVNDNIVTWQDVTGAYVTSSGTRYDPATGRAYVLEPDGSIKYLTGGGTIWRTATGLITDAVQREYLEKTTPTYAQTPDGVVLTGRVPVYGQQIAISAAKRAAVRRSFTSPVLPTGKYEIRVRRETPKSKKDNVIDEIYFTDLNEITLDTMAYPHTALVALKIKLSDQISGVPKVTFMHGGRLIQTYGRPGSFATKDQWFDAASKNPAWIVWDILTHRRYGGAMPASRLDFPAFQAWAKYCDDNNLQWNGPIDTEMNVWDATQLVLRVGHSQLVNVGTRYTIVTEKPAAPVMMFSVANMIEGSYKETWLGTTDRANEIDVTFFDKEDNYKQRTVKVYDPAVIASGQKQRTSAITLYGVTDYETAYREGQFQLNLNRYILKTVSFSAPLEAVACSVGDLVYVQHDMTNWAVAGRFDAGSTHSDMKLDRPVTMEAGKQYKLLAVQDAVQRAGGSVYNVAGTSLFLTGFNGDERVKRIHVGGRDLRVAGIFNQGAGFGVIVDDATGIAAGTTYSLWDTDVIEEYNVLNRPGESDTVRLMEPMAAPPKQFVNWMFGESDKVKKPFRIRSITGSHEYQRDITAIEYKEEVYDYTRYGNNTPVVPPKDGAIGPVTNLTVYEETYVAGNSVVTKAVASWNTPKVGYYAGADVYVRKNGGQLVKTDDARNRTSSTIEADKGDAITVRVVAYDLFGKRSEYEIAPQATYTVIGELPDIDVGGVTGAGFTWAGRDCKINWRYNSVTHSYEFGSEPNGADAGALDPHFKDYEIRVYDRARGALRRTEYTTDNSYTYIYDKNFADGLTRHLVFEIRMRDIFNNLGEPAVLDAYNPPPVVATIDCSTSFESATVAYTHSNDADFAGARIWLSEYADELNGLPPDSLLVYSGPDTAVLLPNLMFAKDYYIKVACFDAFGATDLVPSSVVHFKTTNLNVDAIADGVLKDSMLIPELKDRIDLIDAPATTIGSVAQRILDEKKARDAAILQETQARVSANESMATSLSAVAAKTDQAIAAVQDEAIARTTAISAEASRRQEQMAEFDTNIKSYVQNYAYSKATADQTTNQVYTTLRSEYGRADDALYAKAQSYVQSYGYTKAQADSAIATQVNQVTARLDKAGGAGVTVEQAFTAQANTNSGLLGQYTVKVDANGYVSGFGLASTVRNGVPSSEFIINADKFAVVTNGGAEHPFTIGTVNGVTRTIIKSALIGDASIDSAKIGNAAINNAKIATAAVDTLTIAGNAVTMMAMRSGKETTSVVSTFYGQSVFVSATANVMWGASGGGSVGGEVYLTLYRDGVEIGTFSNSGRSWGDDTISRPAYVCVTGIAVDAPGTGTHTYSASVSSFNYQGQIYITQVSLAILEGRR